MSGIDATQPAMLLPREPVLSVCGPSGVGKTTVLEQAIPLLRRRGLRVAVVKHGDHRPDLGPPGKDSARLFAAGADVLFLGRGESFCHCHEPATADLGLALRTLLDGHDLVLVEGLKGTPLPKVWLAGADEPAPPPDVDGVLDVLPRDGTRLSRLLGFVERWLPEVWNRRPVFGGVLIGGGARRMGRPKQMLRFGGRTLVEVACAALAPHVERVALLGSGACPPDAGAHLRIPDVAEACGPLAGMLAAMRWAPRAAWVFAACDLPLASPEAVGWLLSQRCPGTWAVLPRVSERGVEPLLALYEPQAGPLLEGLAASGRAEPRLIAHHPAAVSPAPPPLLAAAWRNVNTPEDFAAVSGADDGGEEDR